MALISPIDFLKQPDVQDSVAGLSTDAIKSMTTQFAKDVNQPSTMFSTEKGAGKFGFTPEKLESLGMIVPGTTANYCQDPTKVQDVLSNPAVWTGKHGVENLDGLLQSETVQHTLQQTLFADSHTAMLKSGLLTGQESAASVTGMLSGAASVGPAAMKSLAAGVALPSVATAFASVANNAKGAVSMISSTVTAQLPAVTAKAAGFLGAANVKITSANIHDLASQASGLSASLVKGAKDEIGGLANNLPALNKKIQDGVAVANASLLAKVPDMKAAVNTANFGELGPKLKAAISNAKVPNAFADKIAASAPSATALLDKAKGLKLPAVSMPQLPSFNLPAIPTTIDMSNPTYQTVTKTGLV
jgi:hypothetical protein